MKLQFVSLLAVLWAPVALSQATAPQPSGYVQMDGHCKEVHPGDSVSYSLTIENLPAGQPILADIQMRPSHELPLHGKGLPAPDFRNLGGGGMGQADGSGQNTFSFSFVVPKEIYSGRYRGVEVLVKSNAPVTTSDTPRYVDISHHTIKQVHAFCLTVVSPFGTRDAEPVVTNFQPGWIAPKQ